MLVFSQGLFRKCWFLNETRPALVITRRMNTSHAALVEGEGLIGGAETLSRCILMCPGVISVL